MTTVKHAAARLTFDKAVDIIAERAAWGLEHRRLHDEAIEALIAAGVFRLRVPARFGGDEADMGTLARTAMSLAEGDGSAAWNSAVSWITTWMACQFPDSAQEEVFASGEGRLCGTLSPSGTATAVADGVLLHGRWGFISGLHHSNWHVAIAIFMPPESEPYPIVALVPTSELAIDDDWDAWGMRGSGSVTAIADGVFVPEHRVVPLPVVMEGGGGASETNSAIPAYAGPLMPTASASSVGVAVGLARAAKRIFLERMPGRSITYTDYRHQAKAPVTHLELGWAELALSEAEFHVATLAELVDSHSVTDVAWTTDARVQARGLLGAGCARAQQAVNIYANASGGSSVYRRVPIRGVKADLDAITMHALMHPLTNVELFGRSLAGQEPNSAYL